MRRSIVLEKESALEAGGGVESSANEKFNLHKRERTRLGRRVAKVQLKMSVDTRVPLKYSRCDANYSQV